MIKRWEIRENTLTHNAKAVYVLLVEGTDDSAVNIAMELSAFCRLVNVKHPPFTHIFELLNITDESILEKIRIKIEELSGYVAANGDVNERTKHVNLDVISPETEIFGRTETSEAEPAVFMEESDFITDKAQVRQTASNVRDTNDRDMSFDTSMNNNTLSLKPDFTNEAAFASARTEEERVNASDIFGQEESRGKVHLSDGNFYIKKDSSSLDSFAVEAENDMDVGDGTFINLSGAESTQLKEFEDTNPNIQNEDTVNTGAGIGTAIRGKYGNTGLEQSQRELPSLRLMGHLANDAGQNRREFIKDPYKQESDERDIYGQDVREYNDSSNNSRGTMQDFRQNQKINKQNNQARKGHFAEGKSADTGHKLGGFLGGVFNKIMGKVSSANKKEEHTPIAFGNRTDQEQQFDVLPAQEQSRQMPVKQKIQQEAQFNEQADVSLNNIFSDRAGVKQDNAVNKAVAKPPEVSAPGPVVKPTVNSFHSIAKGNDTAQPLPLDLGRDGSEELSAKIQVDDIFAAETICDFYAEDEDTSTNNVDKILGVSSSAPAQKNNSFDLNKRPLGGDKTLMDVPENLLSSPLQEDKDMLKPAKPVQNTAVKRIVPQAEHKTETGVKIPLAGKTDENFELNRVAIEGERGSSIPPGQKNQNYGGIKKTVNSFNKNGGILSGEVKETQQNAGAFPKGNIKAGAVNLPGEGDKAGYDAGSVLKTALPNGPSDVPKKPAFGRINIKEILAKQKEEVIPDRKSTFVSEKVNNGPKKMPSYRDNSEQNPAVAAKAQGLNGNTIIAKQVLPPKPAIPPKPAVAAKAQGLNGNTIIAKQVLSPKPAIPPKPAAAAKAQGLNGNTIIAKQVLPPKPAIPPKPVNVNLNMDKSVNKVAEKTDFKITEQINKGEKKVIMTQDSSNNNFNKPTRPSVAPVSKTPSSSSKPGVPGVPKVPATPRPAIPGVRRVIPGQKPAGYPNTSTPGGQVRSPNPAKPNVPGRQQPAIRQQNPAGPRQTPVPSGKPMQNPVAKPASQPRAATSVDHTILISAGQIYKKNHWPLEIPLNPLFTFDNMDMASNRFAHATAMSVIDNVGTMHNPFMLYGESGTGKSHFLNAMGYEISKKIGQEKIFLTNGVRLSRGVQRYVEEGNVAHLEEFFSSVEVLIIDDIHLTAVNEHNREFISHLLNRFLQEHKQIIISSKYPPESLARFEELVRFRLDQGWVSELKAPRQIHFSRIHGRMLEAAEFGLNEDQKKLYLERINKDHADLSLIARDIKRVQVLSRRINNSGLIQMSYDQILNEMLALDGENPDSEILTKDFIDVVSVHRSDNTEWGNFGFFYPQDQADKFKWMAYCVMQKAKELGIKGGFNFALKSSYSTDHIISAAFKIANICDTRNLKGAIILGPDLSVCPQSIRDNFYDILTHMLEVMMIRCGIIDAENIKMPSAYVRVLGDLLK